MKGDALIQRCMKWQRYWNQKGLKQQIFHIGKVPVRGCIACGACGKLGKCVFDDDPANEMMRLMQVEDSLLSPRQR